ncbi:MAG: sugar nucleotide-binding protein [Candidatus Magasanikbacteria bacterium]|nr:sugar nucleotide-binding protein [Candidatus Magasanikbacteria bacterium]
MNKQNILLIGSSGFLGSKIFECSPKKFCVWKAHRNTMDNTKIHHIKIDLTDTISIKKALKISKPKIVIYASRIYPHDSNPKKIKIYTKKLVQLLNAPKTKLIYFSSDAVFDGEKGNYKENDKTNPKTDYGKAKLSAEQMIKQFSDNFLIIRTGYILGRDKKNFDKRSLEVLNCLKKNQKIERFDDIKRSTIKVEKLAKIVWKLIDQNLKGIIHVAEKKQSPFEMGLYLAKKFNFDSSLIIPVSYKKSKIELAVDTTLNIDKLSYTFKK